MRHPIPLRDWYVNDHLGPAGHRRRRPLRGDEPPGLPGGPDLEDDPRQGRDAFREAFAGWKIDDVATFGPDEVERLRQNGGIIRNRLKIEGVIENARRVQSIRDEHGGFCRWFYDEMEGHEYPDAVPGNSAAPSNSWDRRSLACG